MLVSIFTYLVNIFIFFQNSFAFSKIIWYNVCDKLKIVVKSNFRYILKGEFTLEKIVIRGGNKLCGEVSISGAKNAAVAILPAC